MATRLPALNVLVQDDGQVVELANQRHVLGPLAGAVAELSETSHANWHKRAWVFVTFPDGTLHKARAWDSRGITRAQLAVAQFNALARAAASEVAK